MIRLLSKKHVPRIYQRILKNKEEDGKTAVLFLCHMDSYVREKWQQTVWILI